MVFFWHWLAVGYGSTTKRVFPCALSLDNEHIPRVHYRLMHMRICRHERDVHHEDTYVVGESIGCTWGHISPRDKKKADLFGSWFIQAAALPLTHTLCRQPAESAFTRRQIGRALLPISGSIGDCSCLTKLLDEAHKTHKSNGGIDPHWSCTTNQCEKSHYSLFTSSIKGILFVLCSMYIPHHVTWTSFCEYFFFSICREWQRRGGMQGQECNTLGVTA